MLCPNCEANHALGQEIGKYPANVPGGKSFCWALMSLLPHSDPAVVFNAAQKAGCPYADEIKVNTGW